MPARPQTPSQNHTLHLMHMQISPSPQQKSSHGPIRRISWLQRISFTSVAANLASTAFSSSKTASPDSCNATQ